MKFTSKSLRQFNEEGFLRAGFTQNGDVFTKTIGGRRITAQFTDEGYHTTVDFLAGIRVLDDPERLLG